MTNNILCERIPMLETMEKEKRDKFIEYFSDAPLGLLDSMAVVEMEEGTIFIRESEFIKNIFVLISGTVEAVDLRYFGMPLTYTEFRNIYAFGGMEIVLDESNFRTTLQAATDCTFIRIPRTVFEKWLYSDVNALRREAKLITRNLLEEGRNDRLFIIAQGNDRIALFLIKQYEYNNKDGILLMNYSRQRIADAIGLCSKTIGRGMKYFEENELITKEKGVISVNRQQYEELKTRVAQIIEI